MVAKGFRAQLSRMFGRVFAAGSKAAVDELNRRSTAQKPPRSRVNGTRPARTAAKPGPALGTGDGAYAGDFTGRAKLQYAPMDDGRPDPGEVVWAWVPFEEDHSQGKDRPVLIIARHGGELLGLMLTSKDHDRDHDQEARHGRYWLDIGTGAWDREGRPSEVRLDRILQLNPSVVRREGAVLDRSAYDRVAVGVRRAKRW
jgi:hypothetical protein